MGELSRAEAEKIEGNMENFGHDLGLGELEPINFWNKQCLTAFLTF